MFLLGLKLYQIYTLVSFDCQNSFHNSYKIFHTLLSSLQFNLCVKYIRLFERNFTDSIQWEHSVMSELKRNRFAGTPGSVPAGPGTPGQPNTPGHTTTPGRTTPAYQIRGMPTPDRQTGLLVSLIFYF